MAAVLDDQQLAREAADVGQRLEEDVGLLDRAHGGVMPCDGQGYNPRGGAVARRASTERRTGRRVGRTPRVTPSGAAPNGPHERGAALAAAPAERIHAAVREGHVPRARRVGDAGRRRPVVAPRGAAASRRVAARRAVVVERRGYRRVEALVVRDALQLAYVRQPPIVVAGEA